MTAQLTAIAVARKTPGSTSTSTTADQPANAVRQQSGLAGAPRPSFAPGASAAPDIPPLSSVSALPPAPQRAEAAALADPLLGCLSLLCGLYGQATSAAALGAGFALRPDGRVAPDQLGEIARAQGLSCLLAHQDLAAVDGFVLPLIVLLHDGSACVLLEINSKGRCFIARPDTGDARHELALTELAARASGQVLYVKPRAQLDDRGDFAVKVSPTAWFWDILWRFKSYYVHVALATLLVNVLTLAGAFFTMIVYDRVVPNQAYSTLWVLAIGATLAAGFEFAARMMRAWLSEVAGKKADLLMSAVIFRRVLGLRIDHKPTSAGSFANTLRDMESLRDFVTSATVLTLADLPFVALFLGVIALVAGPLAWVPTVALLLVLAATLVAQWPIARLTRQYMQGMSRKQAVAVESIDGLEALKANRAEGLMQTRWEDSNASMAAYSARSRMISGWLNTSVNLVQQLSSIALVVWGVYLIHANLLTMGGLFAAVMLGGRAVAPISQVAMLGMRFQQARTALEGLNQLMQREQDRDPAKTYLALPRATGAMSLRGASYRYKGDAPRDALSRVSLDIRAGERVAILGKVGSGKSTLLRIAAGMHPPTEGSVNFDGLDARQIEPVDLRGSVAYVPQDARLFYGSLRQNIVLGERLVSSERLALALRMTGLDKLAAAHPQGLDMPIGENGQGLSGGQRQLVAMARLFARDPSIVLLDEPTSALDQQSEQQLMDGLQAWLQGRTLLMVTHRMQWMPLVDRIIVVDQGSVVADGPRELILKRLATGITLSKS